MDRKKEQTLKTYNESAIALAAKFDGMGPRSADIAETFVRMQATNPSVLEIGCGNGRDAAAIIQNTDRYIGIDYSEELIKLAREKVPTARFEVADVMEYHEIPNKIDIVFAFASLIHLDRIALSQLFGRLYVRMSIGGLIRLSIKYAGQYREETNTDEFGTRTYYLYSEADIDGLAAQFECVESRILTIKDQQWLEMTLRKPQG